MNPYSVLLAYDPRECEPEHVVQTYFNHVRADTPEAAVMAAQRAMFEDNQWEWIPEDAAERARPLLCVAGHHDNLA